MSKREKWYIFYRQFFLRKDCVVSSCVSVPSAVIVYIVIACIASAALCHHIICISHVKVNI